MRQVVSVVKDGRVQYALHDHETDELIEFAQVLVPDNFGFHDIVLLGTNLIEATGLNGRKRATPRALNDPPAAIEAAPARETARERRNRIARERYAAQRAGSSKRGTPGEPRSNLSGKGGTERHISMEEMLGVIAEHPEGITTAQIGDILWERHGGHGPKPGWYSMGLNNRQTKVELDLRDKGVPLPYVIEYRTVLNKDGRPSGKETKFLIPINPPPTATSPVGSP